MKQPPKQSHPLHELWRSMVRRCHDPKFIKRANHGARGITVCARWREDFWAFVVDLEALIGPRPSSAYSLDREHNDGNYEPGNVRWATRGDQARNMRKNRVLTVRGKSMILEDWAIEVGIAKSTLFNRLQRGWSEERTVLTAPRPIAVRNTVLPSSVASDCLLRGISRSTVESRVRRGWSYQQALHTPAAVQRGGNFK